MSARILSAATTLVEQCHLPLVLPSCSDVSTDVLLDLDAETAGWASSEDAEHVMLHLNDEIAGLIEAADMPAAQAGAHSTKPETASLVPGKNSVVVCMASAVLKRSHCTSSACSKADIINNAKTTAAVI